MVRMNSSVSTPRHCANPGVVFPLHCGQIVSIIQRQYIQCTYITHHITTRPTTCANPGVVFPLHCSRSFLLCRLTCCSNHGSRKLVRMLNSFFKAPSYWICWKFELSAWCSNQGSKKLVRTVNCPFWTFLGHSMVPFWFFNLLETSTFWLMLQIKDLNNWLELCDFSSDVLNTDSAINLF